jgi:hypothetical protein
VTGTERYSLVLRILLTTSAKERIIEIIETIVKNSIMEPINPDEHCFKTIISKRLQVRKNQLNVCREI